MDKPDRNSIRCTCGLNRALAECFRCWFIADQQYKKYIEKKKSRRKTWKKVGKEAQLIWLGNQVLNQWKQFYYNDGEFVKSDERTSEWISHLINESYRVREKAYSDNADKPS